MWRCATTAAGKEKVILTYPRWKETKKSWLQTERSYFLGKLEPMVDFKALPLSHVESAAPKYVNSWRGGHWSSSDGG